MHPFIRNLAVLLSCAGLSACGGTQSSSQLREAAAVKRLAVIPGGVHGLTVDGADNFYYSDSYGRGARSIYRLTAGRGSPLRTRITGSIPAGLEVIGNDFWMCDPGTGKVRRYDADLRDKEAFTVTQPWNLTRLPDGDLLAATYSGAVELLRSGARAQVLFSGLDAPFDLAAQEDGNIWVSEQGAQGEGWVTLRRRNGAEITRVGPFDNPEGLVLAADGTLWIADTGTGKIYRYDRTTGALSLHTDAIELPIVGTEMRDGTIVFNGLKDGQYGLFSM
jgi:streptogramin lyase